MKKPTFTIQEKTTVLQALQNHRGQANRIATTALCELLRMDRRRLRGIIEQINGDYQRDFRKSLVLTDTDEGGFWLAADDNDDCLAAARHYRSEKNRGQAILYKAGAIEKKAREKYGVTRFAQALKEIESSEADQSQRSLF